MFWQYLKFIFKDKEQPDSQDMYAERVPFKAKLAVDDSEASQLKKRSDTDGFRMSSNPLFTVSQTRKQLKIFFKSKNKLFSPQTIV